MFHKNNIPTLETMMKSMRAILHSALVLALLNISYGKLIITEIMLQPKTATDATTQWFELYNTEDALVQLKGYEFRFCSNNAPCDYVTYPSFGFVGAYGHVVFGNNGNMATNGGVSLIQLQFSAFAKDGRGQNILGVRAPTGTNDDILLWSTDTGATAGFTRLPFTAGASMAKINALATGDDVANWKISTTSIDCDKGGDNGTPGKLNTYLCPTKSPTNIPTRTPTKAPTRTPTKGPTKAPVKGPTNAPVKVVPTMDAPNKAPVVSAPAAPAASPTGIKPITGKKRCGLLGLSIVCFNGCGMFGRLLNICQQ
jgi:hypothetical protein